MVEDVFKITSESRLYWPYLVSSFTLSLFFVTRLKLFAKSYWFNASVLEDLKTFFFNRFIKVLFILPLEAIIVFEFTKLFLILSKNKSFFEVHWPEPVKLLIFSLSFFVLDDFLRFFQHVLMHRLPFLWGFHKFHHSAHALTPLTLYRVHVVELLLASVRRTLGALLVTCGFLIFLGQFVSFYEILGANAFYFFFSLLGGNLRHSHVPLSFGFLEHIFISPAQHQIHHSKNKKDYNLNYGACFSLWDKLYGSFQRGSSKQKIKFGLVYSERKTLGKEWSGLNLKTLIKFVFFKYKKGEC